MQKFLPLFGHLNTSLSLWRRAGKTEDSIPLESISHSDTVKHRKKTSAPSSWIGKGNTSRRLRARAELSSVLGPSAYVVARAEPPSVRGRSTAVRAGAEAWWTTRKHPHEHGLLGCELGAALRHRLAPLPATKGAPVPSFPSTGSSAPGKAAPARAWRGHDAGVRAKPCRAPAPSEAMTLASARGRAPTPASHAPPGLQIQGGRGVEPERRLRGARRRRGRQGRGGDDLHCRGRETEERLRGGPASGALRNVVDGGLVACAVIRWRERARCAVCSREPSQRMRTTE
jgi:hypothetical protein